jgi:hypothetical protein
MMALSVMRMRSGQTSVQHFVMLHIPSLKGAMTRSRPLEVL